MEDKLISLTVFMSMLSEIKFLFLAVSLPRLCAECSKTLNTQMKEHDNKLKIQNHQYSCEIDLKDPKRARKFRLVQIPWNLCSGSTDTVLNLSRERAAVADRLF